MRRELIYLLSVYLILGVVLTSAARADLVCWWMFDEGSGTVAYDSSGNDHDGTIYGSPSWVSGVGGGALEFDGIDDYVGTGESLLDNRSEFTLACWVRAGNPRSSRIGLIGQNDLIEMGFMSGNIEMWTKVTGTTTTQWTFEDYAWHHITVSGGASATKIYLDGELAVTGGGSANYGTSTFPVNIGGGGVWDASGNWFLGQIDDVRIYNHALSEIEILTVMEGAGEAWPYASDPEPADEAVHEETWVILKWSPGDSAVSHDVYFGESFAEVNDGTSGTFQGNQLPLYFLVGLPGYSYPEGLVPGTTYYWRIDEVETDGVTKHKGGVWSFFVPSGKAFDPYPGDRERSIDTDITLTWEAGNGAQTHTVYFSDDLEAIEDAVGGIPQTLSTYYPGELEFDKTYYWRVDEFDGAVTYKGDVWSFTTMSSDEFWAAAYYVDGGNLLASDSNPGTEARPFKTIGRGVQSLLPGDTLLIKAGTYRETVILTRSGTQLQPIKIRAYPGDEGKVIIDASEPITAWRRCTGPGDCAGNPYWEYIYYADVTAFVAAHPDKAFAIRQVFQHGGLLPRSRYPDAGWSYPTDVIDPETTFADSTVSKPSGYFTGAVCHIKTEVWRVDSVPIASFSWSQFVLAAPPNRWFPLSTRFGYFITSIVGEINEEGEWAYDPAQKRLFLWPKGDGPDEVEVTCRESCLRTDVGIAFNRVRGLTMRNAYRYGIVLDRTHHMTVEDNTIEHSFLCGIRLQSINGSCDHNQILRNTIKHSCSYGINIDETASHNNIEGNYVYATSVEHFGDDPLTSEPSAGLFLWGPFTRVCNNRIDRIGSCAIYMGGSPVNREIFYNYVTNTGLAVSDGGSGLYTGGYYAGPEKDHIHHNIIVDAIGCLTMDKRYDIGPPVTLERYSGGSPGLYVDEEGNNRILEYNTVINSHYAGIFFHGAPGNLVQKNTLYGNREMQVILVGRTEFGGRPRERMRLVDDVVLDNILFATGAQQRTLRLITYYEDFHFGQSDRNYFYNPYTDAHIRLEHYVASRGDYARTTLSLDQWRALSGYDQNSREFSYLNQFTDISIEDSMQSRIVYNASLDMVAIDLESDKYCDVNGNKIYGSVSLQPFESKILIPCDFEIP